MQYLADCRRNLLWSALQSRHWAKNSRKRPFRGGRWIMARLQDERRQSWWFYSDAHLDSWSGFARRFFL